MPGALADNYEALGEYQKALEHVEWFLDGLNPKESLFEKMTKTKSRLLNKIEVQKRGEKIDEPNSAAAMASAPGSIRSIADFSKASYGDQKQYMEKKLPENSEILKLSKQAMLAEHSGDFKKAKEFYGQLLAQKEVVISAQGEPAWVMLHCAVQRTSELTGDEVREKEMLVWIKLNMLDPQGQFHQSLSHLMPEVVDHLNKRIKKYQL